MQEIGNLLHRALERHGIDRQVTATVVVVAANRLLDALLQGTPMFGNVRVVTFRGDELVIACPHTAASHDLQGFTPALRAQLEEEFPTMTFSRIVMRIAPAAWYDGTIEGGRPL